MEDVARDSISDHAGDDGLASPPPREDSVHPKLKGRKKLLHGLQRMSSSQSLLRLHKTSSSGYKGAGKGSISCISLASSSASPYSQSFASSPYGSQISNEFSTAPASVPSTPGEPQSVQSPKIRVVEKAQPVGRSPLSASVPTETKPGSRPATSAGIQSAYSKPVSLSRSATPPQTNSRQFRPDFNFWKDMPPELCGNVLRHLRPREIVRCSRVSKAWYEMCFDGQLWATLDTASFYSQIPADALTKIIKRAGPFARDLNLRGCVQLWDRWRGSNLADVCTNLENISLEGCRIDRSAVHSMFFSNTRLVHINVQGLNVVTDSTMKMIGKHCPLLRHLNVSWCYNICTRGLRKVVEGCPNLEDLRAGEIRGMGDVGFMLELFKHNNLERLILMGCDSLTDESLTALMEGTDAERDYLTGYAIVPPRKLRHLDLSRCRQIGDQGLLSLVNNVPHLAGLQLAKCHAITDTSLVPLLRTLSELTHLDLEELDLLTNASLTELSKSPCKSRLQHLSISYCENLGDVGMLPVLKECNALTNLELDNTRISDLVLIEAASVVRARTPHQNLPISPQNKNHIPRISLQMVVYDCQNVTWTGIREVLSRNSEIRTIAPPRTSHELRTRPFAQPLQPGQLAQKHSYPTHLISLKTFYGYQPTVTEHMRRCLSGDFPKAQKLERKWAEYMIASEEAGAPGGFGPGGFGLFTGVLGRRRRRRVREAMGAALDETDDNGIAAGIARRRRARSGGGGGTGGCFVM